MLALSVVLPMGLLGAVSALDRHLTYSAARREVQTTLDLVAGHARNVLQMQNVVLGAADRHFFGQPDHQILDNASANHGYARLLRKYAGETLRLIVFNADGLALVDSDLEHADPSFDVSDREFFRVHRTSAVSDIYISGPSNSRADGKPVFFVSLRRSSPDGQFVGVIVIGVEHRIMFDFWGSDLPDPNAAAALIKADGTYLVRKPAISLNNGKSVSAKGQLEFLIDSRQERKVQQGVSPLDQVTRLFAYRHVNAFPVLVTYGVPLDSVLASWRLRLGIHLAIGATVSLVLVLVVLHVRRRAIELQDLNLSLERRVEERTAEIRANDKRIRLLAREVDHRAKNALAVVQSILRMTPKKDVNRYAREVEGRVRALAHAQTLLSKAKWKGVNLRDILTAEFNAFISDEGRFHHQVTLTGAEVMLPAVATQPVAMIFHELATNAMKYGALSTTAGRLAVSWWIRIERPPNASTLLVQWDESGGPRLDGAPRSHGFGWRMLKSLIQTQLHGSFTARWESDGVKYDIQIPLETQRDH
ncbi:hypothetical protein JMJ55_09105 [Belnapia sp. T6]|uniref:histidine kinase n=1 Tax=Belnapia mucosa TaxID=2804532 RepID=A0ABS1V458_9PROT|nr:HWE histidine kinase domain-containing protein [Belnapia mucosa]MBL6455479.1 hypothetical protein [Belnapia mucosa]